MKNKRKLIITLILLLVLLLIPSFLLKRSSKTSVTPQSKNTQEPILLSMQTADFAGDGSLETAELWAGDNLYHAKPLLLVVKDKRIIITKVVSLEFNHGELAVTNLFSNNKRQILFTTGVGAHSVLGYFYQLTDNKLIPLCPEDAQNTDQKIDKKADCAFFSDGATICPEDLDGDGIEEIVELGHKYYDSETPTSIYKWSGSNFSKLIGDKYTTYLAKLKQQENDYQSWKTYSNSRFGFSVKYPKNWRIGEEATNGDGLALYKDKTNEVLVYGSNVPHDFSGQSNTKESGTIILNDRRKASTIKFKDDTGKINYIVFFTQNEKQYVFNSLVTEQFFKENETILQTVAKSLTISFKPLN